MYMEAQLKVMDLKSHVISIGQYPSQWIMANMLANIYM